MLPTEDPDAMTGCADDQLPAGFSKAADSHLKISKTMLTCQYCLQQFEHGYPCKCNKELELKVRQTQALENIVYYLEAAYRAGLLSR